MVSQAPELRQAAVAPGEEGELIDITDDEGRSRSGLRSKLPQTVHGSHSRQTSELLGV